MLTETSTINFSKRVVLVLGMHRSGTSALTGVLARLGFFPGRHLIRGNQFNAKGYFEDVELNTLYESQLSSLGSAWDDPRALEVGWENTPQFKEKALELSKKLVCEFDFSTASVLKDPRAVRLFPLLNAALHLVGANDFESVLTLRRPESVIASLQHRDGMRPESAALLYTVYLLEAEFHSHTRPRALVKFSDLLDDWRSVIAALDAQLALGLLEGERIQAVGCEIDSFLDRELDHGAALRLDLQGPVFELANAVFEQMSAPGGLEQRGIFDELRTRLDYLRENLEPWLGLACDHVKQTRALSQMLVTPPDHLLQNACKGAKLELFWANEPFAYTSERSISEPWRYGFRNQVSLTLPDNCGEIATLRLDITDRPAVCTLNHLSLSDQAGMLCWGGVAESSMFERYSDDWVTLGSSKQSDGLIVLCGAFDAHATLKIPPEISTQLRAGMSVNVDFIALPPSTAFSLVTRACASLMASVAASSRQNKILSEEVEQLSRSVKDANAINEQLIDEISTSSKAVHCIEGQVSSAPTLLFDAATAELNILKQRQERMPFLQRYRTRLIKAFRSLLRIT